MIGYPFDYGVMRIYCERQARRAQRIDDVKSDRAHSRMQLGRLCVWLGRLLVSTGERIQIQHQQEVEPAS